MRIRGRFTGTSGSFDEAPEEGGAVPDAPGPLIGSGRDADVYAYEIGGGDGPGGAGWVLRRYRDGREGSEEAAVMAYVHGLGYPVPQVRRPGGGKAARSGDLVMRRLMGPTLAVSLLAGETAPADAGTMLADLLRRLHALPSRRGGGRILHLDLHPENVILTAGGPVVIDWSNSEEGDPGLDRAMSALILAQVVVGDFGLPREPVLAVLTALLVHAPVSRETLAAVAARRRANPTMSAAELAQLEDAVTLVRETDATAG
jgi:aminoglycoside phosphotransferase (APT) family kinase protein